MARTEYCLETSNLTYHYQNNEPVLKGIDLKVEAGTIYGFLGPNGAGKTTTLRILLGLLKIQRGTVLIGGMNLATNRVEILRGVGSLIETPSLYSRLTATENLDLYRRIYRCPRENVARALKLVGLAETRDKKAGQFSLGMKQRLGIAVALLHQPPLLVLDEPTNGLDPNGMIEVRELLQRLNKEEGVTIVISSHLLSEIERLVTHLGIIHKGEVRFQGTLQDLNIQKQRAQPVVFEVDDVASALSLMQARNVHPHKLSDHVAVSGLSKGEIAEINAMLVSNRVQVYAIRQEANDLEKIFMDMIND